MVIRMSAIIATLAALHLAAAKPAKPAAPTKPAAVAAEEKLALEDMAKAVGRKVIPGRRVTIETTKGTFVVALFDKDSPKTAGNFAKLVKKGFYNGTPFHRVIEGFVAQGGDPKGTGEGGPGYNLPFEKNPLKHVKGALGMARSQPLDSAGSQFFVDFRPLPNLDQQYDSAGVPTGGYVVFGQVVKGMDVVGKLAKTMDRGNNPVIGVKPDRIVKATLAP